MKVLNAQNGTVNTIISYYSFLDPYIIFKYDDYDIFYLTENKDQNIEGNDVDDVDDVSNRTVFAIWNLQIPLS